ncbi:helix-turn-helix domain-containing protein [Lactococcus allomyrinae]|uniref:XRE family transcriptional regulator n=1 Tax=Lactococcus allomyrinae TaxID=2419773 RepID=A0A387BGP8_9LACT|nr:helix-turn-helix transcriptional regulator [Lactococcus allomyrinae]AYG01444.1 XRE family transcriptional regulator [Lactococcus allomyrinae]
MTAKQFKTEITQELGDTIREARKAKGLSQKALAESLHFSKQTICGWEKGRAQPDFDTLKHLVSLLDIDIGKLFTLILVFFFSNLDFFT